MDWSQLPFDPLNPLDYYLYDDDLVYYPNARFFEPEEILVGPQLIQPDQVLIHQPIQAIPPPNQVIHQPNHTIQEFIHLSPQEVIQQPGQLILYSGQELIHQSIQATHEVIQYPYNEVIQQQQQQRQPLPQQVIHQPNHAIQEFIYQSTHEVIQYPYNEVIQYPYNEVIQQPQQQHQSLPQQVIHQPSNAIKEYIHHPPQEVIQQFDQNLATIQEDEEDLSAEEEEEYEQLPYPIGIRFTPEDWELLVYYLAKKIRGEPLPSTIVSVEDVWTRHPKDITDAYHMDDEETPAWYFFTPRERKYGRGRRPNRSAGPGYWKATGADKPIFGRSGREKIGFKRNLVYYVGKQPQGSKTTWMMIEYRMEESNIPLDPDPTVRNMQLDTWILCKIYKKAEGKAEGKARGKAGGQNLNVD